MGIVDRIKGKFAENGKSISAIEKECGLGHGTIRRWNENSPAVDKAKIVADFLQVSLEWLVTGKEPGNLTPEEQKLVDLYRTADARGKRSIMRSAEAESAELESSASQIG